MSVARLTDKGRPNAANGLDADSFEAICFAVSEKLRHEYRQSKTWAVETADEMVDQAYIEYAEKSEAEQDEVRGLAGLLITTAVRRSLDKARREGREIFGEGAQAVIDNAEDQTPSTEVLAMRGIEAAELYEAVQLAARASAPGASAAAASGPGGRPWFCGNDDAAAALAGDRPASQVS